MNRWIDEFTENNENIFSTTQHNVDQMMTFFPNTLDKSEAILFAMFMLYIFYFTKNGKKQTENLLLNWQNQIRNTFRNKKRC